MRLHRQRLLRLRVPRRAPRYQYREEIVSKDEKTVTVVVDDLRDLLRNGIDWTDDHGPTVRLADAVNATCRIIREVG